MNQSRGLSLPNQLTLGRLGLCGLFVLSISIIWSYALTTALVIFIVASLTDWLDGYVARQQGQVTDLGKLLDPLADKILISAAFIGLIEYKTVPMWMVVAIIAREFLITGLRVIAAKKGDILAAERFGKHKTAMQMTVIMVSLTYLSLKELELSGTRMAVGLHASIEPLCWFTLLLTIGSGAMYFMKNLHLFDEETAGGVPAVNTPAIPPQLPIPVEKTTFPAFKEWTVITEALGRGGQIVILRKGGIAEGRSGFTMKHRRFWLFPTEFHQQLEKTRPEAAEFLRPRAGDAIPLQFLAEATDVHYLTDWAAIQRLADTHLWTEATMRERFDYGDEPGIHCVVVRMYRAAQTRELAPSKAYDGCKSWIEVPVDPEEARLVPVISDEEFATRRGQLLARLGT